MLRGAAAEAPHDRIVPGMASSVQPAALFEGIPTDINGGIDVGA